MAINLQKGQRISLEKTNGSKLQNVCVGINWGAIEKKGIFGFGGSKEAVDLDASCALFDENKKLIDVVYFGNLKSKDSAVSHSGDDLTGDMGGDDGLDNEVITLDLGGLNPAVKHAAFVLNSFKGQDFGTIPFASIRIYEGTPKRVNEIFATYDIANGSDFKGHVSMVMGIFYNKNGEWKFNAIGEPTKDRKLEETVNTVMRNYL
ncbi:MULTISPECIES: TerD family protein [unclassified Mucilaginibacter]|uniref:TerD family protein n=1 Tax=unclassified Mucilaginibacter TaxID=2617802 RepID=UPI002AC8CE8E|nr:MULTISPECIES: TerD family protein [unclassified Mucilaginibacter]MEB0248715.1 TerD family protein [Mucilaginibacter sp. 5B2]MEB0260941.1 TerD family protein [Mucilaginibacter sp. 10I4]MEB0279535.1 TerD family protein [Mucilaginibacter sp. 10B2]MEB0302280.1 TerD family protein [Mucilaginibacter sp. 5C4]WPX22597.1 TerD family protein [Mucilaginibacter sp. 5C4]